MSTLYNTYTERAILLNTYKKIMLYHQNNYVEILKIMSNAAKNFDILATGLRAFCIIILVQQNFFLLNLYSTKILDLLAKPLFPCISNM